MYPTASSPQYAFGPGLAPVPMPVYKGGGEIEEKRTYGLENAAEMLRQRGRGDDTILAHINPQEAGILKLMGGSGTINPYTGLPEFKSIRQYLKSTPVVKDIYKVGSSIGKEIERGIESIAQNKYLGPIAQMASYLHPVSAALYAGLAPEGSSFDVKGAAKAAAMQQIAQGVKEYAMGTPAGGGGIGTEGASMSNLPYGAGDLANQQFIDNAAGFVGDPIYQPSSIGAVESAVSSAGSAPFATGPEVVNAGITPPIERGIEINQIPASGGIGAEGASMSNLPYSDPYAVDNIGNVSESRVMGDYGYGSAPVETYNLPRAEDASGIRGLDPAGENFLSLAEGAYDLAVSNPKTAATAAYMGYTAYQTKKELDAARDEANRILADRENKKKEEIEWAQSVIRDYPFNFQRLTEEDVRREPRYLRGGGDGMSDSIRARIGGKQEARLADGEFVVPADVVSHLGNGSSNAGAKKLYAMMDRVRRSRTGKTRQAPEVNTRRLMPA